MNEDATSRLRVCLAKETEKYHQAVRRILTPRLGGIAPDVANWLASLTDAEKAKLRQAAQGLLKQPAPLSSPPKGVPHKMVHPFRRESGLSGELLATLMALISQVRGYQMAFGIPDSEFVRRHPTLGSAKSWRQLYKWQPKGLNLAKWEQRLRQVCESDISPGPAAKPAQHPALEFMELLKRIESHAFREHGWTSVRKVAQHAGFSRTTWLRLTAPDAVVHFHMPTWLPRLRESVKRLGA